MLSFYDIFDSNAIAAYWTNVSVYQDDPYVGEALFPSATQFGLELSWIKGKNGLPIELQPSTFDVKAPLRDRVGVSEIKTQMPYFKEAMRVGEQERMNIETLKARDIKFAQPVIDRVYQDIAGLIDGAKVVREKMRMQLLATGKIAVASTKADGRTTAYDYNYDPSGTWKSENNIALVGNKTWTEANAATSNPLRDIQNVVKTARAKGTRVTKLIMTSATLDGMLASEAIVKAINPIGFENTFVTETELVAYVERRTGVTITTYDKLYKDTEGADQQFFPDNVVSFMPEGALGTTWMGTTPYEFDNINGESNGRVNIVDNGVAVVSIKEVDPVNVETIVAQISLPSFEQMDSVFVLKTA